ncbi:TIGR04255 family protein [Morganella morganii subsp. morganii]|uniref:TIGR04255 family protein n=1 Tax=Morganella morganii TaxID=582 RepID=UPI001BDB00B6|nr:TIGR04255 family protein [Morganella morganii]MBT0375140.1 TIGR04255 family protein [Morganella morganii subsp. morganii]
MKGRYKSAPLSYMTARMVVAKLPPLLQDQAILLAQKMKFLGFIYHESHSGKKIVFNVKDENKFSSEDISRTCFLKSDRKVAILFDDHGIEYRTTNYTQFSDFCDVFQKVVNECMKIDVYQSLKIEEVILSYVDTIIPFKSYKLGDFFANGEDFLPLKYFDKESSLLSFSKTSLNKVLKSNHRVEIHFEELPQKANSYIPNDLAEGVTSFKMPIDIPIKMDENSDEHYILLTTMGYELHEEEIVREDNGVISGKSVEELFSLSHRTCRKEFNALINKEVCDEAWGYTED